jgi:hypothetical protein
LKIISSKVRFEKFPPVKTIAVRQSNSDNQSISMSTFETGPTMTSMEVIQRGWEESLEAIPRKMEALEAALALALQSDVLDFRRTKAIRRQMEMLTWLVYSEPSGSASSSSSNFWLFPHLPKELQMRIWRLKVTPNIVSGRFY